MLDINNVILDLNKLSNRLETTIAAGVVLFTAAFIVSRIDKREMKDDMVKMNNQTRAEMKEM